MGFWFYMVFIDSLIPIAMIGFVFYFSKKAPKGINSVFGYRTRSSMRNRETWEYAHKHCGKVWLLTGCVTLSLSYISLIVMLLTLSKCLPTIGLYGGIVCGIQLVILIASIFPTEVALKKKFDSDRQN